MGLIRKSIPNSWGIQSKSVTKLFDKVLRRWMKLWYNKEVINTLAASGTIRTTIRRKVWNKILWKTIVKKHVNNCGCFKHC